MKRGIRLVLTASLAAAAAACTDHSREPLTPTVQPVPAVLQKLERAGYTGPVMIQQATAHDFRGTHVFPPTVVLAGPAPHDPVRVEAAAGPPAAVAAAVTDPDSVDPAHNTVTDSLAAYVTPSSFTSTYRLDSSIQLTTRFWGYDYASGTWYLITSGTVLSSTIQPRASSGGHHHGSLDSQLQARAGRLSPASGPLVNGEFKDTWVAPEFSQEVYFDFTLQYDQGTDLFTSPRPYATRVTYLRPIPPNPDYDLVGETVAHPYDHWATGELLSNLDAAVDAYHHKTSHRVEVNDASMMYGGRFDAGRQTSTVWTPCDDTHLSVCWGYSHAEHRYGTEVDLYTNAWSDARDRNTFYLALERNFAQVYQEGNHYHARSSDSAYLH